jgi:PAS domain S-box-containing protein
VTVRRAPALPPKGEVQPEAVRALGDALLARAPDCVRMCEERRTGVGIAEVGTPEFRGRRSASQLLGFQLFARWLRTGEISTREERTWIGALGELGARHGVSIASMTRGYLVFRDVTLELINQEAERLETPSDVLDRVRRMNSYSCDSSILWMTKNFDHQKELQAAEEVRLNAQLVASEGRFRSVYDSIACGVMVVTADGTITGCNDAAAQLLEFPAEKMIGTNVFSIGSNYKDELGAKLKRVPTAEAVATQRPIRGRVVKHDFGDGRPVRWHQVDAMPIFGGDGELLQVVSTFVDVTAVQLAEELRAESAAKSRFLATMSHELRTPLNSILGFAQLLRLYESDHLDETQRRYVQNIETSGSHLLALISDILELSKVAAGQIVLKFEDVEVAPAIKQVAEEFEPMLAGIPVELNLDLRSRLVAHVDRVRFRQVVVNLVANALKFTEAGSVTISARKRGGQLELRIVDTGIGIPADQIDRVFDEFTQVDSGSTRTHGGTGLGLPLTRRLVELMGGTFTLDSVVGQGTTAIVVLPLAEG